MNQLLKVFIVFILLSLNSLFSLSDEKIELLPHQKSPVKYLMDHPEQKGLLLFHSIGSGKTFIALDYAEKNPDKNVVILLPEFLKSNWISQMKKFGIKNTQRYKLISLDESEQVLSLDLKNTLVIVDEVHKLVQNIRLGEGKTSEHFISLYEKLKTSRKLILLSGTPIFVDTSDISYLANLFMDQDIYPIDPVKFRTEFMDVKPGTSLMRGHATESKLMIATLPFMVTLIGTVTLVTTTPWALPIAALGGGILIPFVNERFPVSQVSFRKFNSDKWKDFASRYISYYNVKLAENEDFPRKKVTEETVHYSDPQVKFFLRFVDENMDPSELRRMLSENKTNYPDFYIHHHSSQLQRKLLLSVGSGREIGNFEFTDESGKLIEAPKFEEILSSIRSNPGQVAIYSNYNQNGIQKLAQFFDRNGMKNDYFLLSPELSVEQQIEVIDKYNRAERRVLLIHPEITEGINLVGTEYFHILEPINNTALLNQIIGRAIRFKSHEHLPKERRLVKVVLWETTVEYSHFGIPTSAGLIRHENWQEKFSEVNPNMWSKGIIELDQNYFLKNETPDARMKRQKSMIENDVESFRGLLDEYSVEKQVH